NNYDPSQSQHFNPRPPQNRMGFSSVSPLNQANISQNIHTHNIGGKRPIYYPTMTQNNYIQNPLVYNSNVNENAQNMNFYQPIRNSPLMQSQLEIQSPLTSIGLSPMNMVGTPLNSSYQISSPLLKTNINENARQMGGGAMSPFNSITMDNNKMPLEDMEYATKLKQLSKYVEPLRKLIFKIEKEDDQKKEIVKLKALLDILSNNSPNTKKVPITTLLKCEVVLARQFETSSQDKQSSNVFASLNSPSILSISAAQGGEDVKPRMMQQPMTYNNNSATAITNVTPPNNPNYNAYQSNSANIVSGTSEQHLNATTNYDSGSLREAIGQFSATLEKFKQSCLNENDGGQRMSQALMETFAPAYYKAYLLP
ncbi:unnamed protein product, partial [Gordionus sp. m RMFG-2023]